MWEQLAGLSFKTLSWGGLVAFIAALIPVVRKIQPITTLTSTNLEKTLLTKEKRLFVKLTLFFTHSIMYLGVIGFFYYCFYGLYTNKFFEISVDAMQIVSALLAYALFISSMFLFHLAFSEKSLIERISGNRKKFIVTYLTTLSIFITSATFYIPSLSASLVIESNYSHKNTRELMVLIVVYVLFFFIYSIGIMAVLKALTAQMDKKLNLISGESFYIHLQENDSKKWYVYYPTSTDLFLLGDTPSSKLTNVFMTLPKKDLLAKKIHVQRSSDEEE